MPDPLTPELALRQMVMTKFNTLTQGTNSDLEVLRAALTPIRKSLIM